MVPVLIVARRVDRERGVHLLYPDEHVTHPRPDRLAGPLSLVAETPVAPTEPGRGLELMEKRVTLGARLLRP